MKNMSILMKLMALVLLLACVPVSAMAGFFSSDTVASYKGIDLDRDELLPVVALLNSDEKLILKKDKKTLDLFIRKAVIRKYLIAQAHKDGLADEPLRVLQMQLSGEYELYQMYLLDQNKLPGGFPKEAAIKAVYQKNIQQFKTPEQVHLRQIYLPVNKNNSVKKQLNEIRFMKFQIKKGSKSFAAYAKSHSKHKESAGKGGDLGWLSRDALLSDVSKALMSKERLMVTQSPTSVRLIELLGTRQSGVVPFANVRKILVEKTRVQKQNELNQRYLSDLLKKNPISIKAFALLRKAMNSNQREAFKADGGTVIASMGDVSLDLNYYLKQLEILESVQHMMASNMDDAFVKDKLIGATLLQQLVLGIAKKAHFDKRKQVVFRIQRVADDILVQAKLQAMTALPASFPSATQIEAAYQQNKLKFMQPDMIHLAQIFIARSKDAAKNKKLSNAMLDLHKLLSEKPAMFAALAKKYSQNIASKKNGGDMGWLAFKTLLPAFKDAVKKIKLDAITPVIKTEQGWHIVRYIAFRKAGVAPIADVQAKLIAALRQAEQNQRIQKKSDSLLSSKSISIDEDESEKLL